jgi:hypothetical protein
MRRLFIIFAIVLPILALPGQAISQTTSNKTQKKEIAPEKLPSKVTSYIYANLPNAKITKAVKQKRKPDATWIVYVNIKSKHHTLIFNKSGVLVNLNGKKLDSTVLK